MLHCNWIMDIIPKNLIILLYFLDILKCVAPTQTKPEKNQINSDKQ